MGYADLEAAKEQLSIVGDDERGVEQLKQLKRLDEELSRTFELKVGRRWGVPSGTDPVALTIPGPRTHRDVLLLPGALREATEVALVNGAAVEVLAAGSYRTWHVRPDGSAGALKLTNGRTWPTRDTGTDVRVTGRWVLDGSPDPVPLEVRGAVTFIVVETFRLLDASPAGELGAEGMTIRPRNPWNFEQVKEAIRAHSAGRGIPL